MQQDSWAETIKNCLLLTLTVQGKMRAIQNKSLEKILQAKQLSEYCCTTLAEALQFQELELWAIFGSITQFKEICFAYSASTVEIKLEIKRKTIQMFCSLYHYSTYMIQSIRHTGFQEWLETTFGSQSKFAISQPVMGKADAALKACYWTRPIPNHSSSFHQVSLPCFRGS